jgi:hypothetical protein
VTVIKPHDLADQLLDRDAHPEWQGKRTRLIYRWPDREDLWQQYAELRRDGLRSGVGVGAANDFYLEQQATMDAGANVGWDARHNPDELSALHRAYNLRIDRGDAAFQAEYQNEPVRPTLTAAGLDREQLAKRSIPLRPTHTRR